MDKWPHPVVDCPKDEVKKYCVDDPVWQSFRANLKGLPTNIKLDRLHAWVMKHARLSERQGSLVIEHGAQIQTSNYINALKRAGQLTSRGDVNR